MNADSNCMQPSFEYYAKTADQDMRCYLSPSPEKSNKEGSGKIICSPPRLSYKHNEPSPTSLDVQLKSGRSLLNSNPVAAHMNIKVGKGTRDGSSDQDFPLLTMPSYPHSSTLPSKVAEIDKPVGDMRATVTPIKLKMRPSKTYIQKESELSLTSMTEPRGNVSDCFFSPIQSADQDDDDNFISR